MSNILNKATPNKSKKIQPKSRSISSKNNKIKLQIKSHERTATHLLLSQIPDLTSDECNLIEENIYNWALNYDTTYLSAYLNKSSLTLSLSVYLVLCLDNEVFSFLFLSC